MTPHACTLGFLCGAYTGIIGYSFCVLKELQLQLLRRTFQNRYMTTCNAHLR